ncbi:MAG: LytR/AlgR family response regulator transcription factor [Saprospiraceae bacterium]
MKLAIICEKRTSIATFVKQVLQLAGYKVVNIITEITELSDNQIPYIFFTDIEFAYIAKETLNKIFKEKNNIPTLSYYQVENNQVTAFWNESTLLMKNDETSDNIFIRARGRLEKVCKQDILFIESDKKYCTINTLNKKYVLRTALKHLFEQLNHNDFVRVHRSYLINKNHISTIDTQNQNIIIENTEIPIGRFYQQNLFQKIKILQ